MKNTRYIKLRVFLITLLISGINYLTFGQPPPPPPPPPQAVYLAGSLVVLLLTGIAYGINKIMITKKKSKLRE